jgi:hypothetical protein
MAVAVAINLPEYAIARFVTDKSSEVKPLSSSLLQ